MSTRRSLWCTVGIGIAGVGLLSPVLRAQGETDVGEIAVLGGATFGIGAKPAVSTEAGYAFSRYGMTMVNVSFRPMGQYTIQPWPARSTVDGSYLLDFGVDFHVRIPIGERLAPYGIAGAGLLWNLVRQSASTDNGAQVFHHYNQFNGALHTGGGLRYYIRKDFGIRPELKVIVSKQVYTQFMCGIFYVTPPNWP